MIPAVALIMLGAVMLVAGPEALGSWRLLSGALLSLCAQYLDGRSNRNRRTE